MRADRDRLREALKQADIPILLMVLVHLTGDASWLAPPFQPKRDGRLFAEESGGLPDEVQERVRSAALEVVGAADPRGVDLEDATLARMMSVCVGEPIPDEYLTPVLEEIGIRPAPVAPPIDVAATDLTATIIGAGISGICAAIRLRAMGVPFVILEKNPSIGGTWFENVYPEAGVDTPNHFYSYSFMREHAWTSYFSKQHEILAYLESVVDRYGLRDDIVFGANVEEARYDEAAQSWRVVYTSDSGAKHQRTSEVLITAVGQVNRPKLPDVRGIQRFAGPIFHTARWPEGLDLTGKRVAMVGTGASAVQAARSIASSAEQLTIFQRSPQWIMPNPDYHRSVSAEKQYLLERVPFYSAWYRFALFWRYADGVYPSLIVDPDWPHPSRSVNATNDRHRGYLTRHLEQSLEGRPDLLAKARPDYPPYGKRMVVDNDWFLTLRRDNVELVADAVEEITESTIRTCGGEEREVDVIVMATGFQATRMLWPLEIVGRDGESIHDAWNEDEPESYLGILAPGFPNMFMLMGPTTALAHGGSLIFQVEAQMRYVGSLLAHMGNNGVGALECRPEAATAYTAAADEAHGRLVFSHPGMNNWYKNRTGRVVTVSPWRLVDYWWMTREPKLEDFVAEPVASRSVGRSGSP